MYKQANINKAVALKQFLQCYEKILNPFN